MKSVAPFIIIAGLILSLTGCSGVGADSFDIGSIKSYRDIPGVTEAEIAAVEALKASRESFSYGQMFETEAFILPDGTYGGFTTRFCELLSNLFDIKFVQEFHEWEVLNAYLDNKKTDFIGDLTPTPERMQKYYMTHPIAERSQRIFTIAGSDKIMSEKDINGLSIGFLTGTVHFKLVTDSYPDLKFRAVDVDNFSLATKMLKSGEIDAFVTEGVIDPFFDRYGFIESKEFFPLVYTPVSMTTANPELEPIISVVNKYLTAGGIDRLFELYREGAEEYSRYKLGKSFTEQEQEYLNDMAARGAKISVAYEYENYPISFYNPADKEYQGIAVDILKEVSDLTGIEFEAAATNEVSWADIFEKLKAGEVSMTTELLYTEDRKYDFIWSNVPYASSYYSLLSKLNYPDLAVYQVIRANVGIVGQTGQEAMYRALFSDSGNTVTYSTHDEAFAALEKGEIDLLMGSEYTLLHQVNFREKSGFKENVRFSVPMDSMFGFNKSETMLCSIIDKTLPYINTDSIVKGWTSRVFDYSRKHALEVAALLSVFVAALFLALILVIYLLRKNKRFRDDLEKKTATISAIFTSIPDMLHSKDADLRYTSCNPSFETLTGLKESDIIGKTADEIFVAHPEMSSAFTEADEKVISENAIQMLELMYTFPDGSRRRFETIKAPLIQNGTVTGVLGISRDITAHKQAEEEALEASRAKSTFLAHMSHEIRTPMNAIAGMTELIIREDIPQKIYEYILGIKLAGANLLSLINDILDFSKIEAGGLKITPAEYLFSSLINDILIIIRMRVSEKPVFFTANISRDIPNRLVGDEMRIKQILLNVLGNAAKYTNEGFISMTVTGTIDADTVLLTVEVSDSGVGIREEDINNLFDNFVRFDSVKNKDIPGTGLGLAITKRLCEAMEGDISVRSEYGKGSTFTVTIPQIIKEREEKFANVLEPKTKSVLVYDTRSIYADSIARSLEDLGVDFVLAASRDEFYDELKRRPHPYIFVSSAESENAGQIIKELEADTCLVLLMEFGETPATRDIRTIAMPVHAASIANILNDVDDDILYNGVGQEKVRFIAPGARVLVVDDMNTNLKVAEGLMLPYQMWVEVCGSGTEAVARVRNNRYDIIFMDHMMPGMDGIEAAKQIRAIPDDSGYYQKVPIIALTANAVSGVREMFLQNMMDDFLAKPIDIVKLNSLLEKWIPEEKKENYRDAKTKRMLANTESKIRIEGLNVKAGIEMTGGTVDGYLKTLAIFKVDGEDRIDRILKCLENNDFKLYTTNVHAIKSAAASLGADRISDLAKRLEAAGKKGDTSFIMENNGIFLNKFKELLQNINTAISKHDSGQNSEPVTGSGKNELLKLKQALSKMYAGDVDSIMEKLNNIKWGETQGSLFNEISTYISLFDYSRAASLVDALLSELD